MHKFLQLATPSSLLDPKTPVFSVLRTLSHWDKVFLQTLKLCLDHLKIHAEADPSGYILINLQMPLKDFSKIMFSP